MSVLLASEGVLCSMALLTVTQVALGTKRVHSFVRRSLGEESSISLKSVRTDAVI